MNAELIRKALVAGIENSQAFIEFFEADEGNEKDFRDVRKSIRVMRRALTELGQAAGQEIIRAAEAYAAASKALAERMHEGGQP
jgi:hypothetical protein